MEHWDLFWVVMRMLLRLFVAMPVILSFTWFLRGGFWRNRELGGPVPEGPPETRRMRRKREREEIRELEEMLGGGDAQPPDGFL